MKKNKFGVPENKFNDNTKFYLNGSKVYKNFKDEQEEDIYLIALYNMIDYYRRVKHLYSQDDERIITHYDIEYNMKRFKRKCSLCDNVYLHIYNDFKKRSFFCSSACFLKFKKLPREERSKILLAAHIEVFNKARGKILNTRKIEMKFNKTF